MTFQFITTKDYDITCFERKILLWQWYYVFNLRIQVIGELTYFKSGWVSDPEDKNYLSSGRFLARQPNEMCLEWSLEVFPKLGLY